MRAPRRGSYFRKTAADLLQQHSEYHEFQKEFLIRLSDDADGRIDEFWNKLVDKRPELEGDDYRILLIEYLVEARTTVEYARSLQQALGHNNLRDLESILHRRLREHWAERFINAPSRELPTVLKEMQQFAAYLIKDELEPSNNLSDTLPELDLRSDHGGSQLRTPFMRFISKMMYEITGDWCDGAVATLTDIAFPRDEATSESSVRSARRTMRTTP